MLHIYLAGDNIIMNSMFGIEYIVQKNYDFVNTGYYMKKGNGILGAFLLNLFFSVFEFAGGLYTGSIAIISDAVHDLGDAAGIGVSYLLERKSRGRPDGNYTYGYRRYSVIGGAVTTLILLTGSVGVIAGAVRRLFDPAQINYNGMILFAIIGVAVNLLAAHLTHGGDSINRKAVNLHMLEDVLGWTVVLVGAVIMRFTDISLIDPLMSVGVAIFILVHAVENMREVLWVLLERAPRGIDVETVRSHLMKLDGVKDVHHIHIWTIDGEYHAATVHVVADGDFHGIKEKIKAELAEHGIAHTTVETESPDEDCHGMVCTPQPAAALHHHHHH